MNKLINKIGVDKIMHFGLGGIICAVISFILILQDMYFCSYGTIMLYPIIGYVVTFFFALIKEYIIDETKNWKDIFATMLGCIIIHIAICLGVLFNYLSSCLN